jgi:uncharacterized membrane protein HdeD (DUF308 family)/alpha-beta hydrolase superfamily lysophospholipase
MNPLKKLRAAGRLGRWPSAVLGLLCVAVGAVLTLRPFTSLSVLVWLVALTAIVTGVSELATASASGFPRASASAGALWVGVGVAVAAWPGLTLRILTIWVGVGLIVAGALRGLGGIRGTADQRIAAVLSGVASVVFGVLALSWPDVTVLVIAVVFGARTVLVGLSLLSVAVRGRPAQVMAAAPEGPEPPGRLRRARRGLGAVASLVVAVALLAVSVALHAGSPSQQAFYAAPTTVPSAPGVLLRSESFTTAVPSNARAWRILYTTTRDTGVPAVASALVVAPEAQLAGPRPVIAWAHGTTGIAVGCAPSLSKEPFTSGALFTIDQVIAKGWVLVATDYTGLGTTGPHPYLIGEGEARSVLDAVQAARQLPGLRLADETVVWGHSQGGNAALWAGVLAPGYAPEDHVVGVAALAPASDLPSLAGNFTKVTLGSVFAAYVISAYSAAYADVSFDHYVIPAARSIVRATAGRCLGEPQILVSVIASLAGGNSIFAVNPDSGPLSKRLQQNTPTGPIQAPVFLAQGEADPLILPAMQATYVKQRCALGGALEYRIYPGLDHVGLVTGDSPLIPDLLSWTQGRFDGKTAPSDC